MANIGTEIEHEIVEPQPLQIPVEVPQEAPAPVEVPELVPA